MGNKYTSGAVSIFAVIFATLLLTVLTIGFISLMIVAQQRAINNDLSQSAYDAALAGVEDAKRAVRACADDSASPVCAPLAAPADCKVIARAGINGDANENETRITSNSSSGGQFDQAYTCVNISMNSPDYLAKMTTSNTQIVPLRATGSVDEIVIQWFTQEDNGGQSAAVPGGNWDSLPPISGWNNGAPPLLRVQLITPGESFSLNELNGTVKSSTVFLRPSTVAPGVPASQVVTINDSSPARATVVGSYNNSLNPVACSRNFAQGGYACQVTLKLEENRGISEGASQNALLRLDLMYRDANVRVSLFNGPTSVDFNGVQPVVDSTGRASDLFRRVESRLRLGSDFSYPSYVVDLENALCKDFAVNDTGATGSCNP